MWQDLLAFTQSVLAEMGVASRILTAPFQFIADSDYGLRKALYTQGTDYEDFCKQMPHSLQELYDQYPVLSFTDRYGCESFYIRLPDADTPSLFCIGPFTYTFFTGERIAELLKRAHIPEHLHDFMRQYYLSLPVVASEHFLESLLYTLIKSFWPDEKIELHHISEPKEYEQSYSPDPVFPTANTFAYMERQYEKEDTLMYYISTGNLDEVEKFCSHMSLSSLSLRIPDLLRNHKNNLIIFNTLCRKAAQSGGVHPVYLDSESNKIAQRIENALSLKELEGLFRNMPRRYCMLVCSYSMKDYSAIVQKVIMYINFHIEDELTLQLIAEKFSVNKNYLSTLFKKDTGKNLTDFIKEKRIERAIYLLNISRLSMQSIADTCGFHDLNYFSRVFKQQIGMSPTSYRKQLKQQE